MSESANSSNQSSILKEMYSNKKKRRIPHMADGGQVQHLDEGGATGIPDGYEPMPEVPQSMQSPQALGQPQPYQLSPSQQALGNILGDKQTSDSIEPDKAFNAATEMGAMSVAPRVMGALAEGPSFSEIAGNEVGSIGPRVPGPFEDIPTTVKVQELDTSGSPTSNKIIDLKHPESEMHLTELNTSELRPQLIEKLSPSKRDEYLQLIEKAKTGDPKSQATLSNMWSTAKEQGWRFANGGEVQHLDDGGTAGIPEGYEAMPESDLEQAKAFGEGALQGVAGPLAPVAEQAASQALFNQSPEQTAQNIRGREAQYPLTHMAGEVTGLGGSMATGLGEGAMAMKAGEAVAAHVLPEAAAPLVKIGSRAVSDAIANMGITSSDELTKMVLSDPNQSVESAASDIGLSGLIGGTLGAGAGSVSELWKASGASGKLGEALGFIQKRLGGVEGAADATPTDKVITASGLDLPAAQRAVLNNDPGAQSAFSHLMQSDETSSGKEIQEGYEATHKAAADNMISALGKDPEQPIQEFSKAEAGKNIGSTLAKEYADQVSPLAKEFESLKAKTQNSELIPDREVTGPTDNSNPYNPKPGATIKTPGTVSKAQDDIAQLAQREGWMASPSSDIMREVNRVTKELPGLKSVKDLTNYITAVGDNTASTLPFGQQTPLSRAGSMIKNILRDAESDVTINRLGEKEGPETIARYQEARKAYSEQAKLKDFLNDNLKVGGSTAGFAKGVSNMAKVDSETLFNRLSGKNNASLLDFLTKNYPQTAEAIKSAHVDSMLDTAAGKAGEGAKIDIGTLRKSIEKMSPEVRNFIMSPETISKIDTMGQVLDKLQPKNYNFSNTARTLSKHMSDMGGSAMAVVAHMSGAGPIATLVSGVLGKYATHSIPDAMRLSLLKFLGSGAEVNAPAFKAMIQSIESTIKGDSLLSKAAKNVFTAEREVLPESMHPTERDRTRLQNQLDEIKSNPQMALNAPNPVGHYMPEHGIAQVTTVTRAATYLDSIKPATTQSNPLDTPIKPTASATAAYNNALNIASQPLIVMNRIKAGTATPQDVVALKSMYPNLYNKFAQRLTSEMTEAISKGKAIPYNTRMGLSLFLGQPLDSTMTPASIVAAQPQPPQPQAPTGAAPGERPKHSMKALDKAPNQYRTPDQARAARAGREKP
jgi:hypothetical protein